MTSFLPSPLPKQTSYSQVIIRASWQVCKHASSSSSRINNINSALLTSSVNFDTLCRISECSRLPAANTNKHAGTSVPGNNNNNKKESLPLPETEAQMLLCACRCALPGDGEGGGAGDGPGLNSNFCDEVELLSVSMPSTNLRREEGWEVREGAQGRTVRLRGGGKNLAGAGYSCVPDI